MWSLTSIGRILPGWFPHLPEQSQYKRRLRGLVELISIVQQQLARWLDAGGVRLADGTQLAVASYPGCQQRSEFAGFARWGVRLVLLTDERGLPLGYTIVPANEQEYEPLADLLTGTPAEIVIADKGLWGPRARRRGDASRCPASSSTLPSRSESPAKESEASASAQPHERTRSKRARAASTPASQRIVLPIPASPESTSAVGPRSTSARNASRVASSLSRPITARAAMTSSGL